MTNSLRDELFSNVQGCLQAYAYSTNIIKGEDPELEGDAEFWLDPKSVVFLSSPKDQDIYCGEIDDLIQNPIGALEWVINDDILSKCISENNLNLAVLVCKEDEDTDETYVAVVDRGTGCAYVRKENLTDNDKLSNDAKTADFNKGHQQEMKPTKTHYRKLSIPGNRLDDETIKESYERLMNLLVEIERQALSKYMGRELRINEGTKVK